MTGLQTVLAVPLLFKWKPWPTAVAGRAAHCHGNFHRLLDIHFPMEFSRDVNGVSR